MRMGLETLVRAGLLERRRGKGTIVRRPPIQQHLARFYSIAREMRQRGLELQTQVLARGRFDAQDEVAALACERLGLADPSQVGYLLRLRLVEGIPLLLETVTFPASLCPVLLDVPMAQADDPGAASFYEVLRRQTSMQVTSAHETFRPTLVTGYEARLLGISTGTPVFEVERTSFVESQKVEWRRTLARGDRYSYAVDLLNPVEEGDMGE
jgi:GntR family transcriptional regulator